MIVDRNQGHLRQLAAIEALRGQLHNLEETIASILNLMKILPKGEVRDRLFADLSALDSIADVMRQALDSMTSLE
jgi:hypothetical protein